MRLKLLVHIQFSCNSLLLIYVNTVNLSYLNEGNVCCVKFLDLRTQDKYLPESFTAPLIYYVVNFLLRETHDFAEEN